MLSGAQPTVSPLYNTRSTADVLLAAAQLAGETAAQALPFSDEVAYIQSKLTNLIGQADGSFAAPRSTHSALTSSSMAAGGRTRLNSNRLLRQMCLAPTFRWKLQNLPVKVNSSSCPLYHRPWLKQVPTNPGCRNCLTPQRPSCGTHGLRSIPRLRMSLGLANDDVVKIISEAGEVEAPVYLYPAIHPEVIAMPFGQGHSAYGRYAGSRRESRGRPWRAPE